jgi:hypothetical protein
MADRDKNAFSTSERSIIGRVTNSTDSVAPCPSAAETLLICNKGKLIKQLRGCIYRHYGHVRHATRVYTAVATHVSWLIYIWQGVAVNPVRKINNNFTFERSIIGR